MTLAAALAAGAAGGFAAVLGYAAVPSPLLIPEVRRLGPALRAAADPCEPLTTATAQAVRRLRALLATTLATLPASLAAVAAFGGIWALGAVWFDVVLSSPALAAAALGASAGVVFVRWHRHLPRRRR